MGFDQREPVLAVLEGQLFLENIGKEASKFLRAYNREFDTFNQLARCAAGRN